MKALTLVGPVPTLVSVARHAARPPALPAMPRPKPSLDLPHTFARLAASDDLSEQQTALLFMAACKSNRSESVGRAIERIAALASDRGQTPFAVFGSLLAEEVADLWLYDLRCKNQIARTLLELSDTFDYCEDLRGQISANDARLIWGIGPKLGSWIGTVFGGLDLAVLDVHVLAWLAAHGTPDVPSQTPQDHAEYRRLSEAYFTLRDAYHAGQTPAEADLYVWKAVRMIGAGRVAAMDRARCPEAFTVSSHETA